MTRVRIIEMASSVHDQKLTAVKKATGNKNWHVRTKDIKSGCAYCSQVLPVAKLGLDLLQVSLSLSYSIDPL